MTTINLTEEIVEKLHTIYEHTHDHSDFWVQTEADIEAEAEIAIKLAEALHEQEINC